MNDIPNKDLDRVAWLKHRKDNILIGSSDISTIVGLNKYNSPLQLYFHFKAEVQESVREENDYMWLGNKMEPVIIELIQRQRPELEVKPNSETVTSGGWQIATPDGYAVDNALVEIKCTRADLDTWKHSVPDYAHCQVIWQMGVTGRTKAYVCAMLAGNPDLIIHEIEYDHELFLEMVKSAEAFRQSITDCEPPGATHLDSGLVDRMMGERAGEVQIDSPAAIVAAEEYSSLAVELTAANKRVEEIKQQRKQNENILKMAMQDKAVGMIGNFRAEVKEVTRNGYEVKSTTYNKFNLRNLSE